MNIIKMEHWLKVKGDIVLKIIKKKPLGYIIKLFVVLLFVTACQNHKSKQDQSKIEHKKQLSVVTDTFTVNGVLLELINDSGKAILKINSKNHIVSGEIKLSAPCYFLKWNGNVQSFAYADVMVDHTLIILGDTVGIDRKKYFGFDKKDNFRRICGEAIQGILIKKDSVIITERVLDCGFRCEDPGTDEKDYWDFAHNRETIKDACNLKYR